MSMSPEERLALLRIVDRLEGLEIYLRSVSPEDALTLASIAGQLAKLAGGRK